MNFNFFKKDIDSLKNSVTHIVIEYHKATKKIKDAEDAFKKVKETTVQDFNRLQKSTLEKTVKEVVALKTKTVVEEEKIDSKYNEAKTKLNEKRLGIDALHKKVEEISGQKFFND